VKSILKWQLKIGFVWSTGYLYWQLPVIIIFKFLGPVLSGQYSMSANIINSIMSIGQIFVRTKAAVIGELRASNNTIKAFKLYKKATMMSYVTVLVGFFSFFIIWILLPDFQIFKRMLSLENTFILAIVFVMTLNTLNQAMYTRCSKEEPFFYMSIFVNFGFPLILLCFLHINLSIISVLFSFFLLHIIEIIWGNRIFRNVRLQERMH
jgi:O-antigen/teichoic acid export membrane protein